MKRRPVTSLRGQALGRVVPAGRMAWSELNASAEKLIGALDAAPELVVITSGRWSVIKLLALALARVGRPARLDLWSWTISRRGIRRLTDWRRDGVRVRAVIDASLRRRQPAYCTDLAAGLGENVRFASSHVKGAAVRGPDGAIFVAGSANANLCRRAELLLLSRDPMLAAWLAENTDRLFAAIAPGVPRRADDAARAAALERAFPPSDAPMPLWAAGLPTLAPPRRPKG